MFAGIIKEALHAPQDVRDYLRSNLGGLYGKKRGRSLEDLENELRSSLRESRRDAISGSFKRKELINKLNESGKSWDSTMKEVRERLKRLNFNSGATTPNPIRYKMTGLGKGLIGGAAGLGTIGLGALLYKVLKNKKEGEQNV